MFEEVYKRVSDWNAARYDRVYHKELAHDLVLEEFTEWCEARDPIQVVDALCDMMYVSMGIMWKAKVGPSELVSSSMLANEIVIQVCTYDSKPGYYIATYLVAFKHESNYPATLFANLVIRTCLAEFYGMGWKDEEIVEAMLIVCDSNDSKAVPETKVKANIKANIDKGDTYVSPEARLGELMRGVRAAHN